MALLQALEKGIRVFDLAVPMQSGMPAAPANVPFSMALSRRHGDSDASGQGGTASNAVIITGDHVGTHIDALSHVASKGILCGGVAVSEAMQGGKYVKLGADSIKPMVCRGVFLDIPALKGKTRLDPGYGITDGDLQEALGDTPLNEGDVVLIRTGWIQLFSDPVAFLGHKTGTPGPDASGGRWLASHKVRAAGGDTISFEQVQLGPNFSKRPCHGILLWENGIHIIEVLDMEELAREKVKEFLFVLSPLKLVGATGSPVRPLAVVETRGLRAEL
jgi:kynurenine formamidase